MTRHQRFAALAAAALAAALALALGGCASLPAANDVPDEAQQNRAYMAEMNRHAAELQDAFATFEDAVADGNVVRMNAALAQVDRIVADAQAAKATDRLKDVKAGYDEALDELSAALHDYSQAYDPDGKTPTSLAGVQKAYDAGIEALQAADELVVGISKE